MFPEMHTALTGAVDAAASKLRTLRVPEEEIAKIRQALLTAGEGLKPSAVPSVAPKNFGGRGQELAHHTALVRERFVDALTTMSSSFEGQATSLRSFTEEMNGVTDGTTAVLTGLQVHTEALRTPPVPGSRGGDR